MARPKEFDRDMALQGAISIFSEHGYEGTSTDALMQAMGIRRQSMYDTFGDKRSLYLEALERYCRDSIARQIEDLNSGATPLKSLAAMLTGFIERAQSDENRRCLGISAISEFGRGDEAIAALTDAMGKSLRSALERKIAEAKAAGEAGADVDVKAAAQFMLSTLSGLKVAARGGASRAVMTGIAQMAMRSLR